mmetsp:Transcript_33430/g.38395  ORF Transcript_33430/g.38395 Transcript_33430/m.38395 type:complete len:147 (+) Transcript_33430:19-459(+)
MHHITKRKLGKIHCSPKALSSICGRLFASVQEMNQTHSKFFGEKYDKTQVELMKEPIILVDENDVPLKMISKKDGHLRKFVDAEDALPHRAFSVFLFNEKNELLLQKRSSNKITFPNMWTNTCCSHPLYTPEEMVEKGSVNYQGIK